MLLPGGTLDKGLEGSTGLRGVASALEHPQEEDVWVEELSLLGGVSEPAKASGLARRVKAATHE